MSVDFPQPDGALITMKRGFVCMAHIVYHNPPPMGSRHLGCYRGNGLRTTRRNSIGHPSLCSWILPRAGERRVRRFTHAPLK